MMRRGTSVTAAAGGTNNNNDHNNNNKKQHQLLLPVEADLESGGGGSGGGMMMATTSPGTSTNGIMSSMSMSMSSSSGARYDDDSYLYTANDNYDKLDKKTKKKSISGFLSHRRKRHHLHNGYNYSYYSNNNNNNMMSYNFFTNALFLAMNNLSSSDTTTTTTTSLWRRRRYALVLFLAILTVVSIISLGVLPITARILMLVTAACVFGALTSLWLSRTILLQQQDDNDDDDENNDILNKNDGTNSSNSISNSSSCMAQMRAVSDPIRQGAAGFLHVQYTAIAQLTGPIAFLILMSYQFRPTTTITNSGDSDEQQQAAVVEGVALLGNTVLGMVAAIGFCFGATCSALSGYVSMWVAAQTNIRVAAAAATATATAGQQRQRSYQQALVVCFRGGAFSAVLNLTLCIAGITALYIVWHGIFITMTTFTSSNNINNNTTIAPMDIPMLLVGYGFGASFVALFMQLGGGIYTKAADVGADLVGKIEQSIPEDDVRNPATIADLVGDLVGDCVGSSADVFESVAAEIIGAMILGSTLAAEAAMPNQQASKFIFFPLVVHAMDILVSTAGIAFVGFTRDSADSDPMKALQRGYRVALGCSIVGFFIITHWLLVDKNNPGCSFKFFLCGIVGMLCAYVIVLSTQYYTDYAHRPVQSIAEASTTGHGTNIIVGVSVGMKATFVPIITVAIAVLTAYHLGASTGIGDGRNAGLFGTAVATMGMLSNAVYILSMNNFGPIADNAGGITEMSMQPEHIRDVTDRLDAAGNVTKAVTKGYSIGSASMACFLLFGAFMDEFSEFSGLPFKTVDIAVPEVLIGGLLGSMIIFFFSGLSIAAVGRTAHDVVIEVRRQFKEDPDIMSYKSKPDYQRCVELVTMAALREMRVPGLLCVVTPVLIGLCFRFVGESSNRPLLGAEVLAAYLMFGTVTGILMALFFDTAGGAWDNAKKYIELGNYGGKGSEAHKASVTGDVVGDPFKDTAGPSLHVVIKLLSTTILIAGPLFITNLPSR